MTCSFVRDGYSGLIEERKSGERRAEEEEYGAWKVVCDIWNKVALRRRKELRRRVDSADSGLKLN